MPDERVPPGIPDPATIARMATALYRGEGDVRAAVVPEARDYYFLRAVDSTKAPAAPAVHAHAAASAFPVERVRRDFPALHQSVEGHPLVWLDNAATTQKPRQVIDAVSRFYERDNSNVHRAAHTLAARATDAYEGARETVRRFLGAASTREIVFVRGATEAINLVAQAWGRAHVRPGDEIVLTQLEHHANIVPWQMLAEERGARILVAPIDDAGQVDLDAYAGLFTSRTRLAAFAHASNVLGTVLPVRAMVEIARAHGAVTLVDGAQAVPHFPPDVRAIGADFYVFSGHKLFAPTGVGVLYGREALLDAMTPWQGGGSMITDVTFARTTYAEPPHKFEAGTPALAPAVGLGAAIDYLQRIGHEAAAAHEAVLVRAAMDGLGAIRGVTLIGTAACKVGVASFVLEGVPPAALGRHLASRGIAVRAGHHCAQPTVRRYGLEATVRASVAFYNTRAEIELLIREVDVARRTLR